MKRFFPAALGWALLLAAPVGAEVRSQHGGGRARSATSRPQGQRAAAVSPARDFINRTTAGGAQAPKARAAWGASPGLGRGFQPQGVSYFRGGGGGGTRYQGALRGETLPPVPAWQGQGVPGALIRTAGLESLHGEPSQPERQFGVAGGPIQLNPALADNSANYRQGVWRDTPLKNPTPNPGGGASGMTASGNNSITPNGQLFLPGTYGAPGSGQDFGNGNGGQNNGNGNGGNNGNGQGNGNGNGHGGR